MDKRRFIKALTGAAGVGIVGAGAAALGSKLAFAGGAGKAGEVAGTGGAGKAGQSGAVASRPLLIQTCPVAGFLYYEGERLWSRMKPGDGLELRRAPENKYDNRAVEVHWNGDMLGHLPRIANTAISQMMDRGEVLHAAILTMKRSRDPWQRVTLGIWCGA